MTGGWGGSHIGRSQEYDGMIKQKVIYRTVGDRKLATQKLPVRRVGLQPNSDRWRSGLRVFLPNERGSPGAGLAISEPVHEGLRLSPAILGKQLFLSARWNSHFGGFLGSICRDRKRLLLGFWATQDSLN